MNMCVHPPVYNPSTQDGGMGIPGVSWLLRPAELVSSIWDQVRDPALVESHMGRFVFQSDLHT